MLTSNQRFARNMVAHQKVKKAITRGELERSDVCELCGKSPDPIEVYGRDGEINYRHPIFAHHWNGHKNALDVWWICQTCNAQLRGDDFHNGSITKEEARAYLDKRNKILDADMRAGQWLARANELEEAGKANTKAFEEANRKAQYWLDRLNALEGYV